MMPNGPQQEPALEHSEGVLNPGQLNVRFPELLGRPTALIAPQQVGAICPQGYAVLGTVPTPTQQRPASLGHRDCYEDSLLGEATLDRSDALEDLASLLQPPAIDSLPEFLQGLGHSSPLRAANCSLLLSPGPAPR